MLLITDEYSGICYAWTTSSKTEAFDIIVGFENKIQAHTGIAICKIQMDVERPLVNLPE
jgi:hypothetical protein